MHFSMEICNGYYPSQICDGIVRYLLLTAQRAQSRRKFARETRAENL